MPAPGGDSGAGILSTLNAGTSAPGADNYVAYMGTSMATPQVAGVAALMFAVNKTLTPDQVAALLKSSARAFPAACAKCGSGIVDAQAAVTAAAGAGSSTTAPAPAPTPAPVVTPVPATVSEVEPNETVAAAQKLAGWPTTVSGAIGTTADLDHFRISLPAGKQVVVTLAAGSASGFGLAAYYTNGQAIITMAGSVGRSQQLTLKNTGSVALDLVFRVSRTTGSTGAYTLQFAN
jgi:serine protease